MVKISSKLLLTSVIVFLVLIGVANAAESRLVFSDVDVKVGGKTSNNLNDGETIDEQAEPGDQVEFRVKVQNNFTSDEKLRIEDITVKVTIEGIDDDEDLEEESNQFDLSAGSDKRVTLKFEVPIEVDEDTFDVVILAEGEDKNGTNHESEMRLKLEVDKKSHLLKIIRASLSPAEVSCKRNNVQLAATVLNIGSEDEEDVTFQVSNTDLGIEFRDEISELTAEPHEEESRFAKIYTFNVPNGTEAGSYPILLRALYDDDRKKREETVTLTVNDCITKKPEVVTEKKEEKKVEAPKTAEEGEEVEVVMPPSKTIVPVISPKEPLSTIVTQESALKSDIFVAGILIAEVAAMFVGIVLVVFMLKRRTA